jgi:hypothetical protein
MVATDLCGEVFLASPVLDARTRIAEFGGDIKGYDEVAQKIKAIAAEHGIPMIENIELARALAREVQVGQPIKAKWFKPVAEILAAVYRLRRGAA